MDKIRRLLIEEEIKYRNNEEDLLADSEYDAVVKFFEASTGEIFNSFNLRPRNGEVKLKFPMPSTDKLKDDTALPDLKRWVKENPPPYITSDKIDGTSLQVDYCNGEIFITTGGDGDRGNAKNFIKDYVEFPMVEHDCVIRGELTIDKDVFDEMVPELQSRGLKATNPRSIVNGAVNRKDADPFVLSRCKFVAFGVLSEEWNIAEQFDYLDKCGFTLPEPEFFENDVEGIEEEFLEYLHSLRTERVEKSKFRLDGIVLVCVKTSRQVLTNESPPFMLAVKVDTFVTAVVKDVEWKKSSRYGKLIPVAEIEPIELLGSTIRFVTCNNAKFIIDHQIGPESIVTITLGGDIIPKIVSCLVPSEPIFPDISCHLDENEVHLIADNIDDFPEFKVAKMLHFLKTLKIKTCGPSVLRKLYDAGITDIDKLVKMKVSTIAAIEGRGEVSGLKLAEEIRSGVERTTYPILMAASSIFGEGCGTTIMELFVANFPTWEFDEIKFEDILEKLSGKGIGEIRARQIAENLPAFTTWIRSHPECKPKITKVAAVERDLEGQVIVYTGFDNVNITSNLVARGAIVKDNWVKATTMLIAKDVNASSSKATKAKEKGIPIVPLSAYPDFQAHISVK